MNSFTAKHVALYTFSLDGGGAERVYLQLATNLIEKGFKVDLVLVSAKGTYLQYLPSEVRVIDLKCRHAITSLFSLVIYLIKNKPSVLLSTQHYPNAIALLASKISLFKGKTIIRQANMLMPFLENKSGFVEKTMHWLLMRLSKQASEVITLNKTMADEFHQLTRMSKSKIHIINNPVNYKSIKLNSKLPVNHRWLQESENIPVIIAVGRFYEQKNFKFLINSFAELLKKRVVRLIIIGDGPLRPDFEVLVNKLAIDEFVDMPGFQENPYAYMSKASVFVLSSSWEGFPNVLVEAMACNTPVIATDCPGACAEILENGKWGELVTVDNIHELVRALENVLTRHKHPNVQLRIQDFEINKIVEKYIKVML